MGKEIERKGTLSDAINAVSTMDIVEDFNVPYMIKRGRTYLLCPGHDDTHFGSCYIDKNDNGYYCYVCGEQVTKWNMVLQLNGNRKQQAAEWFFKTAGITPAKETISTEDPIKKANQLIKKLEEYFPNGVIYNDIYTCEKIDSSYGRNINGEYLYSEVSIANPLLELYKVNKAAFKELLYRRIDTEIAKRNQLMRVYDKNPTDGIFIEDVGLIENSELKKGCENSVQMLQNLIIEINEI